MASAFKSIALDAGKQVLQAKVGGKVGGTASGDPAPYNLGRSVTAAFEFGKAVLPNNGGSSGGPMSIRRAATTTSVLSRGDGDEHTSEPTRTATAAFAAGRAALRDKETGEPTALGRRANAVFDVGARALQSKMGDKAIPLAALTRNPTAQSFLGAGKAAMQVGGSATDSSTRPSSFRHAATSAAASHATNLGKSAGKKWLESYIAIPRIVGRVLQAIFCGVACAVYGALLKGENGMKPAWLCATFVAAISVITAALFALSVPLGACWSRLQTYKAWPLDLTLGILWLVIFGLFASVFMKRTDEEGDYKGVSTKSMKSMIWVDLVCSLLWLTSGTYGALRRKASRKADEMSQRMVDRAFTKTNTFSSSEEVWGKA